MRKAIEGNNRESRQKWLLRMMKMAGSQRVNVKLYQFWQQHNHPIELWSKKVIDQKIEYIHNNPVVAGFVKEPHYWKYSSAGDYCGSKGAVDVRLG